MTELAEAARARIAELSDPERLEILRRRATEADRHRAQTRLEDAQDHLGWTTIELDRERAKAAYWRNESELAAARIAKLTAALEQCEEDLRAQATRAYLAELEDIEAGQSLRTLTAVFGEEFVDTVLGFAAALARWEHPDTVAHRISRRRRGKSARARKPKRRARR